MITRLTNIFIRFLSDTFGDGIPEGTIMEVTITKPGCDPVTSNIVVKATDLEMFDELKEIAK